MMSCIPVSGVHVHVCIWSLSHLNEKKPAQRHKCIVTRYTLYNLSSVYWTQAYYEQYYMHHAHADILIIHRNVTPFNPGTGTSMKNGHSIVVLRIEKGPFSKDIFSNFTPFLRENKEKSELKFASFFLQNKDIFRNLTPFSREIYPIFQIKSNQIKIKYLHFKSIWTPLYNDIIKTLA